MYHNPERQSMGMKISTFRASLWDISLVVYKVHLSSNRNGWTK